MTATDVKLLALQMFKMGMLPKHKLAGVLDIQMSNLAAQTKPEAMKVAKEMGLACFFPFPNELFLDYDMDFEQAAVRKQAELQSGKGVIGILQAAGYKIKSRLWTKSNNGNAHLYLEINQWLNPYERMILHALLGSDLQREAFNFVRYRQNGEDINGYSIALFETKDQAKLVVQWRMPRLQHMKDMRMISEIACP